MPETSPITESRDQFQPVDDLFQLDIAAGLEKLRARLLDLSNRNRLLNFRFPQRRHSRQQLRFVEADLGVVLRRLRAEEEFGFRAVPCPVASSAAATDDQPDQFGKPGMLSFDEFTNNPETYLDGEESPGVAVGAAVRPRPRAADYALELHIDTSYDLAEVTGRAIQVEVGGSGNELQVLHYADELETILRSIEDLNRTAERESGISTLYLVFGFIEWYEDPASEVAHLAPLLLLPVVLGRRQRENLAYTLECAGDEVEINRTLQMMLRQRFGISLPDFRPPETLETWFLKIQTLLGGQPRWRIRHQLTLTNLSFHKLRMWEDLDPRNWPENRLLEHPLVRDFFVGRPIEEFNSREHEIDEVEVGDEPPPLVYDADSSQHSALIDALRGRSLVIEGPPGTGKSQTITNLIAAALDRGQSVLFVAEKTTALAVVQRKLSEAGLGDFCLCLGSRSEGADDSAFLTRMREVAENLRQRLANRGRYAMPAGLPQKREILRDYRRRLNDYVWTINQRHGAEGMTIQQTIGIRERLYQSLAAAIRGAGIPGVMAQLESLRLEGAEGLTLGRIEAIEENAGIYEQALLQLGLSNSPSGGSAMEDHPWAGLKRESLDPDEEQAILNALQSIVELTNLIEEELDSFTLEHDLPLAGYEQSVKRLIDLAPLLPVIEPGVVRELLPVLADEEWRREAGRLAGLIGEYQACQAEVAGRFTRLPELGPEALAQLRGACRRAVEIDAEQFSLAGLRRQAEWLASTADYIAGAAPLFAQLARHLECELDYDLTSARMLVRALVLLNEAPLKALASRGPGLAREGVGPVLTRARQEAEQVRKLANSLANRVDRNLAPPPEAIARYAVICSNAGIFRFVSRDFREAQRDWLGMVRQEEIRTARQMARDYRDLLNFQREMQTFTSRPEYVDVLGELFRGLQTPFAEYEQVVKWYDRIRLILGQLSVPAQRLAEALFTVPVSNVKALIHFKDGEAREEVEDFVRFYGYFEPVLVRLPGLLHGEGLADLNRLAARLRELAAEYNEIGALFDRLGVATELPLGSLEQEFDALERLGGLGGRIVARQDLAPLLGVAEIGVTLEVGPIRETIDFIERMEATALPTDFRQWFEAVDIDYRVGVLRTTTERLRTLYNRYLLARERFRAVSGIDEADWYRSGWPVGQAGGQAGGEAGGQQGGHLDRELSFAEVRQRAQRALAAKDELPVWLMTRRAHRMMVSQGLGGLAGLIESGRIPAGNIVESTRFIRYNSLLMGAFRKYSLLVEFNGVQQDEIRRRFAALDREVMALTREEIASRLDQTHVPPGNSLGPIRSYTELGLIAHLAANQNARIGLRQLVQSAAGALVALKPCFMMSPLAVAKYLPPESIRFDLVVMDEASQLRPEDALGAVARGGQLVVVGDRRQLPPTSFFNSLVRDEEAEAGESPLPPADLPADLESMLEIACARYQPVRGLKWHYRSRHESLIAFSNHEFYHDTLQLFPSPLAGVEAGGVSLRHVADGIYDQNRNWREAEEVVTAAIDHLLNRPRESLGIIALNLAQRSLILDLLERALREHPAAAHRFHYWQERGEEVFVKNLELVQGDERDAIFISGTVGRDPAGRFRLTAYGPLTNTRYGHRRLNVMVTRARRRVILFSSITADDILPGANSSWGVRAMKDYLAYAATGQLARLRVAEGAVAPPLVSDLVRAVANTLRDRGLTVATAVGVAGYRLDLAISHPQRPDRYLLGIECDGDGYQAGHSTRDRDRLRQSVLEGLGWNLHHIWSTDWFRSREQEVSKVIEKVALLAAASAAS